MFFNISEVLQPELVTILTSNGKEMHCKQKLCLATDQLTKFEFESLSLVVA